MIKVFLLDDDELHNELNVYIMKLVGVNDVSFRTTGREAIKYLDECKIRNEFPDILFVDLNIPGTSGFKFIEHFEQHFKPYCPTSKIVMLTNSSMETDRAVAMNYKSVLDFINKPLSKAKILEIIEKLNTSK